MNKFQAREAIEKDLQDKLDIAIRQAEETRRTIELNKQWLSNHEANVAALQEALRELRGVKNELRQQQQQ